MPGEENQFKWRGVRPVSGIRGIWPAIDSVRVNKNVTRSTSGLSIIYNVPANKKLFIAAASLFTMNQIIQSTYSYMHVRNAAHTTEYMMMIHYHEIVHNFNTHFQFSPALEAEADWDVLIVNNNNDVKTRGFMFGWIEDA